MKFKLINQDFRIPRSDIIDGIINNNKFLVGVIVLEDDVYAEMKVNDKPTDFVPVCLTKDLIEKNPSIFERV